MKNMAHFYLRFISGSVLLAYEEHKAIFIPKDN